MKKDCYSCKWIGGRHFAYGMICEHPKTPFITPDKLICSKYKKKGAKRK